MNGSSPAIFSIEKLGMDNKVQEPDLKLHSTLQGSREVMGWESGSLSFDLAKSFTHNPRLMSPSNFRSPSDAEVSSITDDLISFRDSLALEILGPGNRELSAESTPGKSIDSVAVGTPGYSIPVQVQDADASPRSLSQMLNGDHQLMFFPPETTFISTTDDEEDNDERNVSDASESASSKLNWSLSASFSSLNSDASRGYSGRSSSDGVSDGSSPEVFAKRRRKRRKTALPSSPSSSSRSSRGDFLRDSRLSQCSEEVSGILADAPATPNFHDSDAECSSGSPPSTKQQCPIAEDRICGSLFQPLATKVKYDHSVTFRQNPSIRDCRKPKPRRLTENLNQNEPYSFSKNVHNDKLLKKFTQREGMWEKENVNGSLFRPRNPARNLSGHRRPVRGCNFNTKTDSSPNFTTAFDDAWPSLLKTDQYAANAKERLLTDPAVLTVGEVVQRAQWPNKIRDSSRKAWFRLENVSDLFNSGKETPTAVFQQKLEQLFRSNNKSTFGTLLEDPAVLYACRDNGQNTIDHHDRHHQQQQQLASHHQTTRGNHVMKELIVWAACDNTSLPNDPAIIAVGEPLLPAHTGLTTSTVQF